MWGFWCHWRNVIPLMGSELVLATMRETYGGDISMLLGSVNIEMTHLVECFVTKLAVNHWRSCVSIHGVEIKILWALERLLTYITKIIWEFTWSDIVAWLDARVRAGIV